MSEDESIEYIHNVKGIIVNIPIKIKSSYNKEYNCYNMSNEELGINSVGSTLLEARKMFEESILIDYQMFSNTPDEELTKDAIKLKRELISIFGKEVIK